jgi:hypothetical protein
MGTAEIVASARNISCALDRHIMNAHKSADVC